MTQAGVSRLIARSKVSRMKAEGRTGCLTVLDVPPAYLSAMSGEELRAHCL